MNLQRTVNSVLTVCPSPGDHPNLFSFDSVFNLEAEILEELYSAQHEDSFFAFIHGHKHPHLRFVINPRGAIPELSPEEVAVINADPLSNHDGIWYLSHLESEWRSSRASSSEDKRVIAVEHYRIETPRGRFLLRDHARGDVKQSRVHGSRGV